MTIKKVSDGTTLLSFTNSNLMTIRANNEFLRPKWGIYRSLNVPSALRDETLRFASISIAEETPTSLDKSRKMDAFKFVVLPTRSSDEIRIRYALIEDAQVQAEIIGMNGFIQKKLIPIVKKEKGNYTESFDVSELTTGCYFIRMTVGHQTDSIKINIQK